ncbi:lysophospholipase L1-like esterase [Rhodoblastus sphagnicola]|uniref:SGNH/GDSL hydrolase family protein n=1 Tax=Rhodoblastus sphagnicola TaxID=333368 RepID=UPI001607BF95|nr:SGNH/GDSL hydrolase family protein [Rhodoblastus sphagnicola]MBB4200540.1 lysophospholipase L1-like esterase [Rhodoblastus sphagnicola]
MIVVELSGRFVGFGHPLLYEPSIAGYELVASQTINRLGKITHINSLGTRGPETTFLPPVGIFRMLVLGDSVANGGTQINDDQTWPMQLQAFLTKAGKSVEVLNAAAGGWAVQNEAAWLTEHGTFGAKLILLEINEKDLDQLFAGPEVLDANVSFPSKNPATALGELTMRYILPRLGLGSTSSDPGSTADTFQLQNTGSVLDAVENIRLLAEAKEAKLAILYWDLRLPAPVEVVPARERLMTYAVQHGIIVIRPNVNKDRKGDHFFRDDIHPNVEGNTAIAEELIQHLTLH